MERIKDLKTLVECAGAHNINAKTYTEQKERYRAVVDLVKTLAEFEDLEEQGRLIILPCKCDEVVWVAEKGFNPRKALCHCPSAMLDDIEHGRGIGYTKAEAEAALERMGAE